MSRIAFLGAGNIAQAIMGGLIQNGFDSDRLVAFDPVEACRDKAAAIGIRVAASNLDAITDADIVLLCVKPNVVLELLSDISKDICSPELESKDLESQEKGSKLIISVAAGITTQSMQASLAVDTALVRCMPNTPALVQTGMTALFANSNVTDQQRTAAEDILSAVGQTLWVEREQDLDAVTAVSGSGPAYFFLMMESMINAAIQEGLSEAVSTQLVLQTALGAARMASTSESNPATLRTQVTSPGGTTQAALEHFEAEGFQGIVTGAVNAARVRSIELSES
jgi:pyrroline-5-carboxylate reductase